MIVDTEAAQKTTNTSRVARNSFWYGTEMAVAFLASMFVSVAVARTIGPAKLGYFNYVLWLANVSGLVGSLGIPSTTSKYMAEFLGRGQNGIARAVFSHTMRLQCTVALLTTAAGLGVVFIVGDPQHRIVSAFQVASVLPAMLNFVPAQANCARENLRANTIASCIGSTIFTAAVIVTLVMHWGLLGIAADFLVYRLLEFVIRLVPVLIWVKSLPHEPLPQALKSRMLKFTGNSIVLMVLNLVVWDRSDVILLKFLSKDISQITFFTLAFNLVEKALTIPKTFVTGVNVTINAQYGRDRTRLNALVSLSFRYLLLFSAPLLLGLAAVSSPVIRVMYGSQYIPMISVLGIAAVLALPRALSGPAQQMLQANEQQTFLVVWGIACAVVNIGLDWVLIPKFGALGAAIGNGIAQIVATLGPWVLVHKRFELRFEHARMLKVLIAATSMMLAVLSAQKFLHPVAGLILGVPLGVVIFACWLRLLRVLGNDDAVKFMSFRHMVPRRVRTQYDFAMRFIFGRAFESLI
jgi:O-antigen/teichoic acid export membrane protein